MKKTMMLVLTMIMVCGFTAAVMAADKPNGDERKGKYNFRQTCRQCHKAGGSAKELGPDSKTMAQWQRTFEKESYAKLACKAEWDKLAAADLNDTLSYLYNHAFDSPSPAKCK
ncbi:MAG: hypothetical protein A2511_00225 [Deltaproteobacteria bacterium RIFOXYD12_FULL_50_9]|nr:MAG: hypothetical protein A2511_00225 [Deltaproteobacteria bacterium RIFOXYD12_FULL_50_9]